MQTDLQIDYNDFVAQVEQALIDNGKTQGVQLDQFNRRIEEEVAGYSDAFSAYLKEDWDNVFPGVDYSEEVLESKLQLYTAQKKAEAVAQFQKALKTQSKIATFKKYAYSKSALQLFVGCIVSLFSVPGLLVLALQPSDTTLLLGAIGLLANIVVMIFLFVKTTSAWR